MYICICVCVYIYDGILLNHKKEQTGSFAETWMDLESVIQTEASQKKETHHSRVAIFHGYC